MSTRHSDNDGSDIFWPGYVDAVTNLVLNLLFLLTIMTVAVFMFALELGRANQGTAAKPPEIASGPQAGSAPKTTTDQEKENIALKREIERLTAKLAELASQKGQTAKPEQNARAGQSLRPEHPGGQPETSGRLERPGQSGRLAQPGAAGQIAQPSAAGQLPKPEAAGQLAQSGAAGQLMQPRASGQLPQPGATGQLAQQDGTAKTVDVTSNAPKPLMGLDKTMVSDDAVIVRFKDDAVAFTPAERDRLLESLKPIVARGKASIYVKVPAGFSEAKRMGLYRVLAVRNLLIEMKMPPGNISQLVDDKGGKNANASLVTVK